MSKLLMLVAMPGRMLKLSILGKFLANNSGAPLRPSTTLPREKRLKPKNVIRYGVGLMGMG